MSFALWSPSYETGHPGIDSQHQRLFGMINGLQEAMRRGHGREALGSVMKDLAVYTLEHFADEEALMKATGYPHLMRHQVKHRELAKEVEQLQLRYAEGYLTIPNTLARFLAEWLKHHIREEDLAFIVWMNEQSS